MSAASYYPDVRTTEELEAVEPRRFVECAKCVEHVQLNDGDDPIEWAKKHTSKNPWHQTFRVAAYTEFSAP